MTSPANAGDFMINRARLAAMRAADIAFVSPPCAGWWPMG